MISSPIIPAIIPQSLADLTRQLNSLRGLPELHLDVVDGIFTSAISWPYKNQDNILDAKELLSRFSLEVDLMVENPLKVAPAWIKVGAQQLVFHIETVSRDELAELASRYDVTIGVALSDSTPVEDVYPYFSCADYVQIMGIAEVGSQGQPFTDNALLKITKIQQSYPHFPISIDGSVNLSTLPKLVSYKLDRYIIGSRIMGTVNPREAYLNFNEQIKILTS